MAFLLAGFINKSHITVQFTPKIHRSTTILDETIYRDTVSVVNIENAHETLPKLFYGKCLPIWDDDGINQSDPYCAFACIGCYPEFDFYKDAHLNELKELSELYYALKNGEKCSLLITAVTYEVRDVEIIGFTNQVLESERKNLLGKRVSERSRFQYLLTLEVCLK